MHRNLPGRQTQDMQSPVIKWLLDSDPSIRWQVMRDLIGSAPQEVVAERARVATEGAGARLLGLQAADGNWGGAAWNRGWDSTMHVLMLLRDMGLDPASEEACRAIGLVRDRVTWNGCGPRECARNAFFDGEIEPCINGQVAAVGAYFGQDVGRLITRLLDEQLPDGGWNCEAAKGSTRSSSIQRSACSKPCSRTNGPLGSAESWLKPASAGRSIFSSAASSAGGRPAK